MNATAPIRSASQRLRGDAGSITLGSWLPRRPASDSVVVLPNGYGMLSYAESVCQDLATHGKRVYSVSARGQEGNPGEYSVPGAADDIAAAVAHLEEREASFHLLVHCSAALPLIRNGENAAFWRAVKSVVLYCYLAEPQSHLDRFRAKCAAYGVQLAGDVGRLDCYGPEAYNAIPVPLAVVHPTFRTNQYRASSEQLLELTNRAAIASISMPRDGYDIKTSPQTKLVGEIVAREIVPLLAS